MNYFQIAAVLFLAVSINGEVVSTTLEINKQYYFGLKEDTRRIKFFEFEIPEKIPNENMILLVNGLTPGSDPDIFVSDSEQFPDSQEKSDIYCSSFDLNICPITSEKIISMQQKFFVGVQCPEDCNFSIRIFYHSEHILELNDEKYLLISNDTQIVKINSTIEDINYENIIIQMELMNPESVKHTFQVYSQLRRDGTVVNKTNFDFMMNSLGAGSGKGVINIANVIICKTNCIMSFLVDAPENSIISFKVRAYSEERVIEPYQIVEDFVLAGEVKYFRLQIDSEKYGTNFADKPLAFSLIPYDGDPNLHVNADSRPELISSYEWQSEEPYEERIVISALDRKKSSNKDFFIAIDAGWQASMFTLKAYPLDSDQLYLVFDFPESGKLIQDQVMNYHLILYGKAKMNVTLRLSSYTGNAHLYLKKCTILEKTSCLVTMEEITGKVPQNSDFFKYSIDTFSQDQKIRFEHEPDNCHNSDDAHDALHDGFHSCAYVVAVHAFVNPTISNPLYNFDAHYTLVAQHDSYVTMLKERQPIEDVVDDGNYNFYQFRLKNTTDISFLNFQLTPLTGHVSMFSYFIQDKELKEDPEDVFPTESLYQVSSFWNSLIYQNPKAGWYYLGVQGEKLCSYTLNVIVERNSSNTTDPNINNVNWMILKEDKPQQISLQDKKIATYFRFVIDTNNCTAPNTTFTIKPMLGQFKVLLSKQKDPLPSIQKYDWKVVKNKLRIKSEELKSNSINNFYGVVLVDEAGEEEIGQGGGSGNGGMWSFEIEYHTTRTSQTLKVNSPHQDHALKGEIKYFKVEADLEADLIISQQVLGAFEQDVLVYVSTNQKVNFPKEQNYQFQIEEKNALTIKKEHLMKSCAHLDSLAEETEAKCYVFISVVSNAETSYTILAKIGQTPIPIFDGLPGHFQLAEENKYTHLFALINANENITIFERSFHFDTEVYVNILKIDQYGETNDVSLYPTSDLFLPVGNVTGFNYNSLIVTADQIKRFNCKEELTQRCALLISVLNTGAVGAAKLDEETFSISLSVGIQQLQEGRPMIATVDQQNVLFYSFYVNEDDTSIMISLTPLEDGDPDMYVSLGEEKRPTNFNEANWGSLYEGSDTIIINQGSKDVVKDSVKGHYVIGVTTLLSESAQFQLMVTTRKNKYFHIDESAPLEVFISGGEPVYLEYLMVGEEEFRITLSRDFGEAVISVNPFNNTGDVMQELPSITKMKFKYTSFSTANQDLLMIPKNPAGTLCPWPCRYLIELYSLNDCKLTVIIANQFSTIRLPSNKVIRDFVNKDINKSTFLYETSKNFTFFINLFKGRVEIRHHKGQESNQVITADQISQYKVDVESINGKNEHYFIEVEVLDNTSANYTILAVPMGEATALRYGMSINSSLEPGKSSTYQFFYLNEDEALTKLPISVSIFLQNADFIQFEELEGLVPSAKLIFLPDDSLKRDAYVEVPMIFTHVEQVAHYQIPAPSQGLYKLTISNDKQLALSRQLSIDFSLVIDNSNIIYLQTRHPNVGYLEDDKYRNYELLIPERSILFLEAYVCQGDMRFSASDNYQEFKNGQMNFEFEQMHSVAHFLKKQVDSGPVYVHAKNLNRVRTFYRLKASVYPIGYKLPYELFYLPEDGFTDFQIEENELQIRFSPIKCEDDCTNLHGRVFAHTYELLMMGSKDLLDEFSRCGGSMMPQQFIENMLNYTSKSGQDLELALWSYKDHQRHAALNATDRLHFTVPRENLTGVPEFYFIVICRIYINEDVKKNETSQHYTSNPGGVELYTYFYSINHVTERLGHDRVEESSKWLIISILLVVFVSLLILVLIFLYQKYQTTNKRLVYELSDVRNVARISIEMDDASTREKNDDPQYKGFADERSDQKL